jgi:two-component system, OmpR family, alkaline phosphatase synthesis response regulator PhoP
MIPSSLPILIVEDEPNLGDTLFDYLTSKDYPVRLATTIQEAKEHFYDKAFYPYVVLMDIGLPDGNGLELAELFRSQRKNFVLLFLSALNDPETKFKGLSLGADDYITKPFDLRELTLRLERILKTKESFESLNDEIQIGKLKIYFKRYEVMDAHQQVIALSQKECAILEMLYLKKNEVLSRDTIIDQVWGADSFPSNRTVDNYIVKLRKWLETDTDQIATISSVRGIGYRLEIKN